MATKTAVAITAVIPIIFLKVIKEFNKKQEAAIVIAGIVFIQTEGTVTPSFLIPKLQKRQPSAVAIRLMQIIFAVIRLG